MASWNVRTLLDVEGSIETARGFGEEETQMFGQETEASVRTARCNTVFAVPEVV